MSVPQRIALTLPNPMGVNATLDQAVWAEQNGYDDVWFADTGLDALTLAAAVAERTSKVRIGTAIIPVFSRTPPVLASTAYVLNQLSEGRFILGIGSSSHAMMEGWHGQNFTKPLTRVKETAELIKSILTGEKTNYDGQTVSSHGYRQYPLEAGAQPVYLAALRSKMLETAAEVGDGVILNLFPLDALPKMMEHIKIGADRAGKNMDDIEIVSRHMVIVTDDKAAGRDMFRKQFAPYYATPVYNKFLAWAGYPDAANTITEGWAEKDRVKTGGALEDKLIDQIAIIGTADEVRDRIREYAAGGVTTHIISCIDPSKVEATNNAFTAENFSFK